MQSDLKASLPGLGCRKWTREDMQPCISAFNWFKSYFPIAPFTKGQYIIARSKQLLISINKEVQKCNEETLVGNNFFL